MDIFKRLKYGKLITLYLITDNENNNQLCTIVSNKKQALEFMNKFLLNENKEHYEMWCRLHNHKSTDINSWNIYLGTVLKDAENRFSLMKAKYTLNSIASMARIANGCIPVGCEYETETELNLYYNYINNTNKNKEENR